MKILFDQGTPEPLRRFLSDHEILTAYEQDWVGCRMASCFAPRKSAVLPP
jgi:hypothetical protein